MTDKEKSSLAGMIRFMGTWDSMEEFKRELFEVSDLIDQTEDKIIVRIRVGFASFRYVLKDDGTVEVSDLFREHYHDIKVKYGL